MTMSTYKSLGGPAGGLVLTNEPDVAHRLDAIAFPGMTANFDAAKSAALAISLLDWREYGAAYAASMLETAQALAIALLSQGIPVFRPQGIATNSHQFAIEAARYGGGQAASRRLRAANILACGIGLPIAAIADDLNGLRLGTPEIVRRGMRPGDMPTLAKLIARALQANNPETVAIEVTNFRKSFNELSFIR
jgi:glycine hydroxymethyltransferase